MTRDNANPPNNVRTIKAPDASGGRPAVVGRIGRFSAANGLVFAGRSVLNVVWHLHSLGFQPLLISRIGNDAEGLQVSRYLEKCGIDLEGVQIDDTLPTSDDASASGRGGMPSCAWEALDWKSAVNIIDRIKAPILFHGIASANTESVQKSLNTIQNRTALPFFVDLDIGNKRSLIRSVRRALLGVKWIRVDTTLLPELVDSSYALKTKSVLDEALNVRAQFALDGIVVEHHGLPILGVWRDTVVHGTVSLPAEPSFVAGQRDAATAALISGLLLGWQGRLMIERAAQFAYLVGASAIAERVDGSIYSAVLRNWSGSESTAAES